MNNGVANNQTNTNTNVGTNNTVVNTNMNTNANPGVTSSLGNVSNQQPVISGTVQSSANTAQTVQQVNTPIVNANPVISNVTSQQTVEDVSKDTTVVNDNNGVGDGAPKEKKKANIVPVLLIIILGLGAYTLYSFKTHSEQIKNLMYNCTPITASKEEIKLELDSTLVKDLYSKVATTIREDLAQPEFNDNLRLYLAYRQILETDKYDSNCNLFNPLAMEPYTCEITPTFTPKAFKEETLLQEIKKLYGDATSIPFANIKLGNGCIGGYQYIAARGEFVQGLCNQQTATSYRVTKTLKEAISKRNTIILKEEVKYHENEKMPLPNYLKSGIYIYTFRLDMNYNYVLVNREYESKY